MRIILLFLLFSGGVLGKESSVELERNSYCLSTELPIFNAEVLRRVEFVFLAGKPSYSFNKKELDYYLTDLCKDNSFLLLKFKDYMENMGYGIRLDKNEILICNEECTESPERKTKTFFPILLFIFLIILLTRTKK